MARRAFAHFILWPFLEQKDLASSSVSAWTIATFCTLSCPDHHLEAKVGPECSSLMFAGTHDIDCQEYVTLVLCTGYLLAFGYNLGVGFKVLYCLALMHFEDHFFQTELATVLGRVRVKHSGRNCCWFPIFAELGG